jgi:NADPH2:quinone reductase
MPNAIRIHQVGGPEVLRFESVSVGDPGPGEARVRHTAVGLNYIDTYHRSGLYKIPLPSGLGTEAAGVIEAVGPGVTDLKAGDRVAYSGRPIGAYAEARVLPIDRLVKLPESVSDRVTATLMLKGLTAVPLRQTLQVKAGETILLHAAAGGIGLIACQWARALGVTVIGTVSSDAKAELAKVNACTHTIVYSRENFVERVKELTGGKGVPVVYDAVGKDTFPGSLDCLQPRGLFVSFGNSSGPLPPFEILLLAQKGSLYVTRPTLVTYTAKRAVLLKMAEEMFALVQSGKLKNDARQTYALKDAAGAPRSRSAEDDRIDGVAALAAAMGDLTSVDQSACRRQVRCRQTKRTGAAGGQGVRCGTVETNGERVRSRVQRGRATLRASLPGLAGPTAGEAGVAARVIGARRGRLSTLPAPLVALRR